MKTAALASLVAGMAMAWPMPLPVTDTDGEKTEIGPREGSPSKAEDDEGSAALEGSAFVEVKYVPEEEPEGAEEIQVFHCAGDGMYGIVNSLTVFEGSDGIAVKLKCNNGKEGVLGEEKGKESTLEWGAGALVGQVKIASTAGADGLDGIEIVTKESDYGPSEGLDNLPTLEVTNVTGSDQAQMHDLGDLGSGLLLGAKYQLKERKLVRLGLVFLETINRSWMDHIKYQKEATFHHVAPHHRWDISTGIPMHVHKDQMSAELGRWVVRRNEDRSQWVATHEDPEDGKGSRIEVKKDGKSLNSTDLYDSQPGVWVELPIAFNATWHIETIRNGTSNNTTDDDEDTELDDADDNEHDEIGKAILFVRGNYTVTRFFSEGDNNLEGFTVTDDTIDEPPTDD